MSVSDKRNHIDLSSLFESTQQRMVAELTSIRQAVDHGTTRGDETEIAWLDLMNKLLPNRYQVCDGFVVDAGGWRSDQIDIIVFDRQYSPPLFMGGNVQHIPAESVYAVFEVKQRIDKRNLRQASRKVASVRRLSRTTIQIPTADGIVDPKPLHRILGGILALSISNPDSFERTMSQMMTCATEDERLDIGCAINDGSFMATYQESNLESVSMSPGGSSLVTFFFQLLSALQSIGTVPAIDYYEYIRAVTQLDVCD